MIGVCDVRPCLRMSWAVSMPSMSGMLTSSTMTANSRSSSSRNASAPEFTSDEVLVEVLEHLAEREAFVGQIVDDEDVDLLFHRQR